MSRATETAIDVAIAPIVIIFMVTHQVFDLLVFILEQAEDLLNS